MAKLKFGAWIPTYAWSGGKSDPKNVKRIRESIEKCEDHGIDVWVIDHLLSERGRRTDEIIEAVTLLLTKSNASFSGKYYQFSDVTIEPRPPKMPPIWVSGGSRVPDPTDHDVPVIATTVMDRIVKAGHWLSRC